MVGRAGAPYIARKHLGEWYGETEPPTLVTVYERAGEVAVAIYPEGTDLHIGNQSKEMSIVRLFLQEDDVVYGVSSDKIAWYARRAIDAYQSQGELKEAV